MPEKEPVSNERNERIALELTNLLYHGKTVFFFGDGRNIIVRSAEAVEAGLTNDWEDVEEVEADYEDVIKLSSAIDPSLN